MSKLTEMLEKTEGRAQALYEAIVRDAKAGRLTMSIPANFKHDTDLLAIAVGDDVKALVQMLREAVGALERCAQLSCDSPIECQDKIIWRCHSCKAKDSLAHIDALAAKEGK